VGERKGRPILGKRERERERDFREEISFFSKKKRKENH
jgi:hypothetical protein